MYGISPTILVVYTTVSEKLKPDKNVAVLIKNVLTSDVPNFMKKKEKHLKRFYKTLSLSTIFAKSEISEKTCIAI